MRRLEGNPVGRFLQLIHFSHTIFALPFALGALVVAADGWPSLRILFLVVVCMVLARTAAMLFNHRLEVIANGISSGALPTGGLVEVVP